MAKRLLAGILSFTLLCYSVFYMHIDVFAKDNVTWQEKQIVENLEDDISDSSKTYIKMKFSDIVKTMKTATEEFNIEKNKLKNVELGDPFVIYDLDTSVQNEEIYYPVISIDFQEVVFVITVIGTTCGWEHSIGTDMVEELNELDYAKKDEVVFFECNDVITGQSVSQKINFSNNMCTKELSEDDFVDQAKAVLEQPHEFEKVDIEKAQDKIVPDGSTSFVSELGYFYLVLQNSKGQGNYNLCWAAAIATIVNYRKDMNVTAKQVADKVGIDYNRGAYLTEAQNALRKYNLYFTRRTEYTPFDLVKLNINQYSPMYMSGSGYNSSGQLVGHAVTIYGYREISGARYLMIWDSASDGNKGDTYMVSYNNASTVFSSTANTTVYAWNGTLLNYK